MRSQSPFATRQFCLWIFFLFFKQISGPSCHSPVLLINLWWHVPNTMIMIHNGMAKGSQNGNYSSAHYTHNHWISDWMSHAFTNFKLFQTGWEMYWINGQQGKTLSTVLKKNKKKQTNLFSKFFFSLSVSLPSPKIRRCFFLFNSPIGYTSITSINSHGTANFCSALSLSFWQAHKTKTLS